ncbi:MAG: hypothetical protein KC486_17100 [Myxococcales bacterium]|nr:hypothetical protein [Myxococcales bacterium]
MKCQKSGVTTWWLLPPGRWRIDVKSGGRVRPQPPSFAFAPPPRIV